MRSWKSGLAALALMFGVRVADAAPRSEPDVAREEVVEVAVELDEFGARPARIELPAHRRVRITVTNVGRLTHTLQLEDLGIGTDFIQPGGMQVLEFVPHRAGASRMTCAIEGHARVGRAGRVVFSAGDGVPSGEVAVDADTERPPAPAAR